MRYKVAGFVHPDDNGYAELNGQYPPFRIFDPDWNSVGPDFSTRERAEELAKALNAPDDDWKSPRPSTVKYAATVTLLFDIKDSGCGETNEAYASDAVSALLTDHAEAKGVINDWGYASFAGSYMYPCRVQMPEANYQRVNDLIYIRETEG